ncbi:26S proteasome non-ATPase regulatory subunit 2 B, partial [Datura stramonium]|nr:26S proteasome non-ATPase regulatory subunit 2 B [Datura stramonium]
MSKTPDPNSTGASGSKSTREEATVKVPSKDPKKKDDKKDEDLSEEDLALKQQLELYVERVQDADTGLQKVALESMRGNFGDMQGGELPGRSCLKCFEVPGYSILKM